MDTPSTQKVWCLLIGHEKPIGHIFGVDVHPEATTDDLKDAVKNTRRPELDEVPTRYLIMWRCKAPRLSPELDASELKHALGDVDFEDEDRFEYLPIGSQLTEFDSFDPGAEVVLVQRWADQTTSLIITVEEDSETTMEFPAMKSKLARHHHPVFVHP